jgi:uncharacterized membrane protein YedE/YeeE
MREIAMFADLGLEAWDPRSASVVAGLVLGALFGFAAQRSRFCLRSALVSDSPDGRRSALALWLVALAVSLAGVQAALTFSPLDLSEHRYLDSALPLGGLVAGGLLFGAGMVLARGCASRLTVLGASGNLRALLVLVIFGLVAFSTMKGLLSPLRTGLSSVAALDLSQAGLEQGTLPALLGAWATPAVVALAAIAALVAVVRTRLNPLLIVAGTVIGGVVAAGWFVTGFLLLDDFDPIAQESIAFTLPMTDSIFYFIASTSLAPNFGVGLIGGVLLGAFAASLLFREFRLQSFESPLQTLHYASGGALMGLGGVLAGGCTVGNGLSGAATLGLAPITGLLGIIAGALLTARLLRGREARSPVEAVGAPAE